MNRSRAASKCCKRRGLDMTPSDRRRNLESDTPQHGDIETQVGAGAVEAVMTQNVPDRLHAHAAAQQAHRKRMPQSIYVLAAVGKPCLSHPLAEDVPDAGAFEWDKWTPRSQEKHRRVISASDSPALKIVA